MRGIDLMFVLDGSGSIDQDDFQSVINFVQNIVRQLDIGADRTQVGLITFDYSAVVQFRLNSYRTRTSLLQAIASTPYSGGGTNTADALRRLIKQFNTTFGARPLTQSIPRVAVVVTDGRSNSRVATITQARLVHDHNILTYAVGVGSNVDITELNAIATTANSLYVHQLSNFDQQELDQLQESLSNQACTGIIILLIKY